MSALPQFVNWGNALQVVPTIQEDGEAPTPQSSMWTDYTAPKAVEDIVGNAQAVAQVDSWFAGPRTAPLLVHGPPGTGKTTLVKLCAAKHQVSLFSSSADEPRTQTQLTGIINNATALGQTVFLDDADMFLFEPTGLTTLVKYLKRSCGSVVLCFNSIADAKLSPLVKTCVVIEMKPIDATALVTRAQKCAKMANRSLNYFDALVLARRCCGDARRLIIELQVEAIDKVIQPKERKRCRLPTLQLHNAIMVKPSLKNALSVHNATITPFKCLDMVWAGWLKLAKTDMCVQQLSALADSISDADLVVGTIMQTVDLHEAEDKDLSGVEALVQFSHVRRTLMHFRKHNDCDDSDEQLIELMKVVPPPRHRKKFDYVH
ncbi:P-loop containing nucleoside triphosphate hydrolase protein [Tribonema minus]|uniref:P-loop containing nucleoside triphosphate hydrolase protein n=1 Tax=Tribonema minus TaxID=303371 RepID=A0A835YYK7_9STRA|nr:P-loop containing nucleoside triphosphate hydrolase protein [Tribonema minus]